MKLSTLLRVDETKLNFAIENARKQQVTTSGECGFVIFGDGIISDLVNTDDILKLAAGKEVRTFAHTHDSVNFLPTVADILFLSAMMSPDRYAIIISNNLVSAFKVKRGTELYRYCRYESRMFRKYGTEEYSTNLWESLTMAGRKRVSNNWARKRQDMFEYLGALDYDDRTLAMKDIILHTF